MAYINILKGGNTYRAYIRVYSHTIGATITAVSGAYRHTATVSSAGYATIRVNHPGTYTITSSVSGVRAITAVASTPRATVTAQYRWGQYNVATKYSDATSAGAKSFTYAGLYMHGYYGSGTTATLNVDTGKYSLSGGSYFSAGFQHPSGTYTWPTSWSAPMVFPLTAGNVLDTASSAGTTHARYIIIPAHPFTTTRSGSGTYTYTTSSNATLHYPNSYYVKGSTHIKDVTDNYPDTYSTTSGGAKSGDYWYVPI